MSYLIDNALEEMENITEKEIFKDISNILKILENYNVNKLINLEIPTKILPENIEKQLILIAPKLKNRNFVKEDVNFLAKWLKINEFFANKSISDKSFTFLCPISTIFYYLQIKPEFLSRIVSKEKFSKINENVFETFNNIDDSFNVSKTAPNFEKEAFKRYKTGLTKDDVSSVYFFIESVERGKGIYPNFFICFLAQLLLIEPSKFFNFLESINEPFTLVKYINTIENRLDNKLFELIKLSNNKWLVLEYLRQIFKDLPSEGNLISEKIESISLLFERIHTITNGDFLIEGIVFLSKSKNKKYLGICTGTFLSNLNKKSIIEKLVESMGINERMFNLDFWTFMGKSLEKENKELLKFMGSLIFNNWDRFLKKRFKDEKIVLGLIYTDYLNIVIWYLQECLSNDKSKFLKLLEEKIDAIINYKSFWVKYPSRKRLVCLSYVYNMSEAWKNVANSEIEVELLKNKILFILGDERMFLSLPDYENSHKNILKIKDNFGLS
ncbi:hypothetical protein [Methanobacterium sp.]|uniref:hypothetical protein n=1 Tax=Methanobacterium sp. TaxID=2164 RepID=UPI0025D14AD7|nr:hypothetical protein [Methanobacterium sp.]MBI5458256.1 hypothetical protein [Methanobacterium sp.]